MSRDINVYRLMDSEVLVKAVVDLERAVQRPAFGYAPPPLRTAYLSDLDRARAELERRKA
jgi:hypothetical protein